jgi:hypothetical protein
VFSSASGAVKRVVVHDATANGFNGSGNVRFINCIAYNNANRGWRGTAAGVICIHCTAVDNTNFGFTANVVGWLSCHGSLASDNGQDYLAALGGALSAWNTSSDLTAPGSGPQTGFNNADFVNYAGDDFRLSTANMFVTLALFDGNPLSREDFQGMLRDRDDHRFWAGASHPWAQPTWPAGVSNIRQA